MLDNVVTITRSGAICFLCSVAVKMRHLVARREITLIFEMRQEILVNFSENSNTKIGYIAISKCFILLYLHKIEIPIKLEDLRCKNGI